MKKFILTVVVVSASLPARALYIAEEPYRLSLEVAYGQSEEGDLETTFYGGTVAGYLPKIGPGREPVAEGVFGQRVSSLSGGYGQSFLGGQLLGLDIEAEGNVYNGAVRASHVSSPVALEFDYAGTFIEDAEILTATIDEITVEGYDTRLVFYLARRSAVTVGYDLQILETSTIPLLGEIEVETTTLSFRAKHLASVRMKSWLNVEGGVSQITLENMSAGSETENLEYSVAADYYPDRFLGFGASFALNDGEDESSEGYTYAFRITYNHGARFGMQVGYEHFEIEDEDDGDDSDAFFISIVFRG